MEVQTMRERTLWLLPLAFFLISFASPANAQFWKKKDYHDWSAKDCRKILTNSPWTKNHSYSQMQMPNGMSDTQGAAMPMGGPGGGSSSAAVTPGRQSMTEIQYTAQFFSALPVREAQVRLNQIKSHYNKMTPAQKKAFDQRAARFLAFPYSKYTVIRVSYTTNVRYWQQSLRTFWKNNTGPIQQSTFLIVDGKAVRLARFQLAPQNQQAFFLFFPRRRGDQPILSPKNKSVTLQVAGPATMPQFANIQVEFKVKKMMFDGKVAY
jgi:hypothetical protein